MNETRIEEGVLMKQQRGRKKNNRRIQLADTMFDVISTFDKTYGKPDERKNETPGQLSRAVHRLCGVAQPVTNHERKEKE